MKGFVSASILLMLVFGAIGSSAQQSPAPPPRHIPPATPAVAPELAIEQIKKCVIFLSGQFHAVEPQIVNGINQPVSVEKTLSGTGFFIILPEPRLGTDQGLGYLVTNKHLIREPRPDGALGPYLRSVNMRYNLKHPALPGGIEFATEELPVTDNRGSLIWLVDPDDESVDLAMYPIYPPSDVVDFKQIGTESFATKDVIVREHFNENDEIIFAGLFAWHPGAKRNYPIVRHGKLSWISQERIPLDRNHPEKTFEVHLADVMSFGGNSGSPVLLRVGGIRETGGGNSNLGGYSYYLLGNI